LFLAGSDFNFLGASLRLFLGRFVDPIGLGFGLRNQVSGAGAEIGINDDRAGNPAG